MDPIVVFGNRIRDVANEEVLNRVTIGQERGAFRQLVSVVIESAEAKRLGSTAAKTAAE